MSKYKVKRSNLEIYIDKEVQRTKESTLEIQTKIQLFESELAKLEENCAEKEDTKDNTSMQSFFDEMILKKEKEFECPVCLDTASSPIFCCPDFHLICSQCLPNLPKPAKCPLCRKKFGNNVRRHRYAEGMLEELQDLRRKKKIMGK